MFWNYTEANEIFWLALSDCEHTDVTCSGKTAVPTWKHLTTTKHTYKEPKNTHPLPTKGFYPYQLCSKCIKMPAPRLGNPSAATAVFEFMVGELIHLLLLLCSACHLCSCMPAGGWIWQGSFSPKHWDIDNVSLIKHLTTVACVHADNVLHYEVKFCTQLMTCWHSWEWYFLPDDFDELLQKQSHVCESVCASV